MHEDEDYTHTKYHNTNPQQNIEDAKPLFIHWLAFHFLRFIPMPVVNSLAELLNSSARLKPVQINKTLGSIHSYLYNLHKN